MNKDFANYYVAQIAAILGPDWMHIRVAAKEFTYTREYLHRLISTGKLTAKKVKGYTFVSKTSLLAHFYRPVGAK